jgi:hypothetical protein
METATQILREHLKRRLEDIERHGDPYRDQGLTLYYGSRHAHKPHEPKKVVLRAAVGAR